MFIPFNSCFTSKFFSYKRLKNIIFITIIKASQIHKIDKELMFRCKHFRFPIPHSQFSKTRDLHHKYEKSFFILLQILLVISDKRDKLVMLQLQQSQEPAPYSGRFRAGSGSNLRMETS